MKVAVFLLTKPHLYDINIKESKTKGKNMNNLPAELKAKILAIFPNDEAITEALGCNQETIMRILYKRLNDNTIEPGDLAKIIGEHTLEDLLKSISTESVETDYDPSVKEQILLDHPNIKNYDPEEISKIVLNYNLIKKDDFVSIKEIKCLLAFAKLCQIIQKDKLYTQIDQIINEINEIDVIDDSTFIEEIENLAKIEWTEKTLPDVTERLLAHYKPAELVTEFVYFFQSEIPVTQLQIACNLLIFSLPMWAKQHKGSYFSDLVSIMGASIFDNAELHINHADEQCQILGHAVADFIDAYNKIYTK